MIRSPKMREDLADEAQHDEPERERAEDEDRVEPAALRG